MDRLTSNAGIDMRDSFARWVPHQIGTRRSDYEDACPHRLAGTMPPDRRVTVLADRGFGDH